MQISIRIRARNSDQASNFGLCLSENTVRLPYEQTLLGLHCTSMYVSLEIFFIVSGWVLSRCPKSRGKQHVSC